MLAGLSFEAHAQNSLLVYSTDAQLIGFAIRDFGGIKIHPRMIMEKVGLDIKVMEGSAILAKDEEEVYGNFLHSGIECHLQCLLRALGTYFLSCSPFGLPLSVLDTY